MKITIVDYNSGNISSVINSFKEVAQNKVNIEVTSDLKKIKSSDKVVLPGQGSFKSCVDALNNIKGLVDTLNEFAIAYDMGKVIGVITGIGKFSSQVQSLLSYFSKATHSKTILNDDPLALYDQVITVIESR